MGREFVVAFAVAFGGVANRALEDGVGVGFGEGFQVGLTGIGFGDSARVGFPEDFEDFIDLGLESILDLLRLFFLTLRK